MKNGFTHTDPNSNDGGLKTVGCFELVSLPEFNLHQIPAKVDTGAYSGALHCNSVELVEKRGRVPYLRFVLTDEPDVVFETKQFRRRKVRSASGHSQSRYLITTKVVVQGVTYPIQIGLSNRSAMKSEMLIGRRFLRDNAMLVDVRANQDLDDEGELS